MPDTKEKTYVAYIRMEKVTSWDTWLGLARCFKLWDLDVRGYHKGMWRFWYKENHIILVGTPFSPYSVYKPNSVTPIYIPKKKKEEE